MAPWRDLNARSAVWRTESVTLLLATFGCGGQAVTEGASDAGRDAVAEAAVVGDASPWHYRVDPTGCATRKLVDCGKLLRPGGQSNFLAERLEQCGVEFCTGASFTLDAEGCITEIELHPRFGGQLPFLQPDSPECIQRVFELMRIVCDQGPQSWGACTIR